MTILHSPVPVPMPVSPSKRLIPPLASGDRLTRSQFRERYAAMPPKMKAERIEGKVYMAAAAVSATFHGDHHANAMTWLGNYMAATPGVAASNDTTIALDLDNDPQPDCCLRILPSHGGRTKVDSKGYIEAHPS